MKKICLIVFLWLFSLSSCVSAMQVDLPAATLEPIRPISVSYLDYNDKEKIFENVAVKIGDKTVYFPWKSETNKEYIDLNLFSEAGRDFLFIKFTHNVGTSVHREDVHIIDRENLQEVPVRRDTNLEYLKQNFHSRIERNPPSIIMQTKSQFIELKNLPYLTKVINTYPSYTEFRFFDNINYRYGISVKHHLICEYALNITPMHFFGNVIVPYRYNREKNIFEIDKSNAPFINLEQVYY